MSDNCNANVWKPQTQCENLFPGDNPNLLTELAALIIGTEDPSTNTHLAAGPNTIQAKSRYDTATTLFLNPNGGIVYMGGTGSVIYAYNQDVAAQQRVLTLADRFFPLNAFVITGTTYNLSTVAVGKKTKVSNAAGCTITIDDSANAAYANGEEAIFIATGAAGITGISVTGSQTLIYPASGTAVPYGRSCSIQKLGTNEWLYTGP